MYKLLIVEDDLIIAQGLQKHFEKYHYEVSCVENFENVLDDFIQYKPILSYLIFIYLFLMATIGVKKYERFLKFLSSLYLQQMKT